MKFYLIFSILLTFWSCTQKNVSIDKLQIKENRYCLKNDTPFTGEAVSNYDNGTIACIIQMKDGVPNGRWVAYGYKGEVVQEGNYQPISEINEELFDNSNIIRLNVRNTKEGIIEFTDVYVVLKSIQTFNIKMHKNQLLSIIKSNSVIIKGDTINEIKYVVAELGN